MIDDALMLIGYKGCTFRRGVFESVAVQHRTPMRFAGDPELERDRLLLELMYPEKNVRQEFNRKSGKWCMIVQPFPARVFKTKGEAVEYHEQCRAAVHGSLEGWRK